MPDLVIESRPSNLGGGPRSAACCRSPAVEWSFLHFSRSMGSSGFQPCEGIYTCGRILNIGLSTVTSLFDGEVHTTNNLGCSQRSGPGR